MKIVILGAGNMGGAIACGLAQGGLVATKDITVTNPSVGKLDKLKAEYPEINVSTDNSVASEADMVIIAVKPWKVEEVVKPLHLRRPQIVVSVAAGISFDTLKEYVDKDMTMFRVIPNTAISCLASTTLIAECNASPGQTQMLLDLFNEMGLSILIEEKQMTAATALTSCGIAFVLKYVQAAMQAGVEVGIRPKDAMKMLAQTLDGAAQLLLTDENTHPAIEIDKVTTPGGITIKGVNQLDHDGFTSAVINAVKACM